MLFKANQFNPITLSHVMKFTYLICSYFLLIPTLNGAAMASDSLPPKKLTLVYQASKDGKPFATVNETFTHDGTHYRIESITKGIGIYALFGERKLLSIGDLTAKGLQPNHFEALQGVNAKKTVSADFDWANLTLNMVQKEITSTAVLNTGSQDLLSFSYQFMFINFETPKTTEYALYLATGKKYKPYKFSVEQPLELTITAAGQFKTNHLKEITADNKPASKEIWLGLKNSGIDAYNFPVKLIIRDDNGTIEEVLSSIHAE